MAMGKPAYLIVSDPAVGPLGKISTRETPASQGTASISGGTTPNA
jgi:hypothetical protein